MTTADDIINAAEEMGAEPHGLRFIAHELFHMLSCGSKSAHTDAIHRAVLRKHRGASLWLEEMRARACEWLVCEHFGVDYDVKHWAFIAQMESIKGGLPHSRDAIALITSMREDPFVIDTAAKIIRADFDVTPSRSPTSPSPPQ